MRTLLLFVALIAGIAAGGCDAYLAGGALVGEDTPPTASGDGDFPCEVRAVLETNCADCHGGDRYITPLTTRDIWLARRFDGLSYGQYAAAQVAAGKMPPPAAPTQPSEDDRALLIDWVAAGMPSGACGPLTPPAR